MKSKSHRYFLLCPLGTRTSHCDRDWCGEYSRYSWVTGHAGHGS